MVNPRAKSLVRSACDGYHQWSEAEERTVCSVICLQQISHYLEIGQKDKNNVHVFSFHFDASNLNTSSFTTPHFLFAKESKKLKGNCPLGSFKIKTRFFFFPLLSCISLCVHISPHVFSEHDVNQVEAKQSSTM